MVKRIKIGKLNINIIFRHKWDEKSKESFTDFRNYEIGLWYRKSKMVSTIDFQWITKFKKSFITYTVIRSYLGLARRDIKHFYKYTDEYSKRKRLGHVVRGYIYARDFIKGNFNFESANLELSRINLDVSDSKMLKDYELKISELRDELNFMFNKNINIAKKFNVNDGIKFNEELIKYIDSFCFSHKQNILKDFNTDSFINSFENWVEY